MSADTHKEELRAGWLVVLVSQARSIWQKRYCVLFADRTFHVFADRKMEEEFAAWPVADALVKLYDRSTVGRDHAFGITPASGDGSETVFVAYGELDRTFWVRVLTQSGALGETRSMLSADRSQSLASFPGDSSESGASPRSQTAQSSGSATKAAPNTRERSASEAAEESLLANSAAAADHEEQANSDHYQTAPLAGARTGVVAATQPIAASSASGMDVSDSPPSGADGRSAAERLRRRAPHSHSVTSAEDGSIRRGLNDAVGSSSVTPFSVALDTRCLAKLRLVDIVFAMCAVAIMMIPALERLQAALQ